MKGQQNSDLPLIFLAEKLKIRNEILYLWTLLGVGGNGSVDLSRYNWKPKPISTIIDRQAVRRASTDWGAGEEKKLINVEERNRFDSGTYLVRRHQDGQVEVIDHRSSQNIDDNVHQGPAQEIVASHDQGRRTDNDARQDGGIR